MARKRTKPEPEDPKASPEEIASDLAALRRWVKSCQELPERILRPLEERAKKALRERGLPDNLGPHLLADLPPERLGRNAEAAATFEPLSPPRVRLDGVGVLVPNTVEAHAVEILVAVREARRALNAAAAIVWTNRAASLAGRLPQQRGAEARVAKARGRRDTGLTRVDTYLGQYPTVDVIVACRHAAKRELGEAATPERVEQRAQTLARRYRERRQLAPAAPSGAN